MMASSLLFWGLLALVHAAYEDGKKDGPVPDGLLPASTPNQWWDPIEPMAAACLSCHDGDDANAHASTNTTYFGESCATCHGEGKEFAVGGVDAVPRTSLAVIHIVIDSSDIEYCFTQKTAPPIRVELMDS